MHPRTVTERSIGRLDEVAYNNDINVRKLVEPQLRYRSPVTSGKRRPGRPSTLSLDGIVAAAVRVIDRVGLEGCTMRAVAEDLGASPMTVYRYVTDKQELLALLPDALLVEVARQVTRKKRAISALEAIGNGVARVIAQHPGTARLFDHPAEGPNITAAFEHCASLLLNEGFPMTKATSAIRAVVAQVIGEEITSHGATDPAGLRWVLDGIRHQLEHGRKSEPSR